MYAYIWLEIKMSTLKNQIIHYPIIIIKDLKSK